MNYRNIFSNTINPQGTVLYILRKGRRNLCKATELRFEEKSLYFYLLYIQGNRTILTVMMGGAWADTVLKGKSQAGASSIVHTSGFWAIQPRRIFYLFWVLGHMAKYCNNRDAPDTDLARYPAKFLGIFFTYLQTSLLFKEKHIFSLFTNLLLFLRNNIWFYSKKMFPTVKSPSWISGRIPSFLNNRISGMHFPAINQWIFRPDIRLLHS